MNSERGCSWSSGQLGRFVSLHSCIQSLSGRRHGSEIVALFKRHEKEDVNYDCRARGVLYRQAESNGVEGRSVPLQQKNSA